MEKLRALRKQKGLNQADVAKILDISQNSYSRYETGQRQPDLDILRKLSDLYQVSIDDLLGRNSETKHIQEAPEIEFDEEIELPIVASLRCSYGESGEPYIYVGKHKVLKSWQKKYGKEIILNYAVGNSMIPTILPGELMLCYPGDWWDDGTVAIVNVNDSDTVKRIYRAKDGGIDLIPDNPAYKIMHYTPAEIDEYHISVLGHVITTIPEEIRPIPRRRE